MKGKPWTVEEEKQLKALIEAHKPVGVIAETLGKTKEAITKKANRLGLEVVGVAKSVKTTTSNLKLPEELPSVEEALKTLAATLKALEQPGLDQAEVLRLRSIIQGVKVYKELLADYMDYRGVEAQLLELRQKYEQLAKKAQGDTSN